MNKNFLYGVLIIVLISIFGFVYYSNNRPNMTKTPPTKLSIVDRAVDNTKIDDTNLNSSSGQYIEYQSAVLDQNLTSTRVLFFYANWCPTCRPVDKEISANLSSIPEGVVIIRVNYNDDETDKEEEALAKKYGITYQHTFVQIDEKGNAIKKWNGGSLEDIISNIE